MSRVVKPNFFIVGGPKCGTTAMWSYLKDHPQVFMCEPKEPWFLAQDYRWGRDPRMKTIQDYLSLFRWAELKSDCKIIGEASVIYLSSPIAPNLISQYFPGAKLLVMVRSPVDAYPSLHRQLQREFLEPEDSPVRAWRLQSLRARGEGLPKWCPEPRLLQYKEILSFGTQLQRLFKTYPRELIHVELFDDFKHNPRESYERVLAFLRVESDGRTDFPPVNERWRPRSLLLASLWNFHRVPEPLRRAGRKLGLHRVHKWVWENVIFTRDRRREVLPLEFRQELIEAFRDEILLLQELLNRDLSHWLDVGGSGATNSPGKLPSATTQQSNIG